jgi:molybdenum cofactor cytidylyltransferase
MNPVFGVAILGAGASSRMGRPKLLLPWAGTTVIGHVLQQWRTLGAGQICIVCAPGNTELEVELRRFNANEIGRITNPSPERGMFSSIQCAAAWAGWKESVTHWAIHLADQPRVRTETLRQLLTFVSQHPHEICQPSYHGRPRHPVIFPGAYFVELAQANEGNLKEFLAARPQTLARCELNDPGLDLDLDTPADYARALNLA